MRWIDGRIYTEEMLHDRQVLQGLGFNAREIAVLAEAPLPELPWLYYKPYVDQFADEYKPFDAKLDHLDAMTLTQLLQKEGASPFAIARFGGSGSALQAVWHAAILKKRGVPLFPPKVYRLKGGNQMLPDTFAARLGDRVRTKSPVTRIEHSRDSGTRALPRRESGPVQLDGDYLVCAMSAVMLEPDRGYAGVLAGQGVRDEQRPLLLRQPRRSCRRRADSGEATASARTWSSATPRSTTPGAPATTWRRRAG